MIGFLDGQIAGRSADGCFVDVGGVGYKLTCSTTTLAGLPADGGRCRLWTHTHVREDSLALFGFATPAEQSMFEALIAVSGVGPKVALAVCSAFTPESFRRALVTDDIAGIASVPGLGKKTASRIIVDLKERFAIPDLEIVGDRPDVLARARSALENLGYSAGEVRAVLAQIDASEATPVEDLVRNALRVLAS